MALTILLFGPQALLAETRTLQIELPSNRATVSEVMSALREAIPALGASIDTSRLAVNHEFAAAETVIHEQDEVALVGMVSGG